MTTLQSRFIDKSDEVSTVGVYVPTGITQANALLLNAAIAGMSIGTNERAAILENIPVFSGSSDPPSNKWAQRELKFLCRYSDNVNGKRYSFTIPCADADLTAAGTDFVPLDAGAGLTLKTRFETHGVSELGNPVTLTSVEIIGRSSS